MNQALTYSGADKTAIILLSLNGAAKQAMLAKLSDREITKIFESVRKLGSVSAEIVTQLAEDFTKNLHEGVIGEENSIEELKSHLALDRMSELSKPIDTTWTRLESLPDAMLASHLSKERAEVVAVLLSKISNVKIAALLPLFKQDYAAEVLVSFARLRPVNDAIIAKIADQTLISRLKSLDFSEREKATARVLEMLPADVAKSYIAAISHDNQTLAIALEQVMLTFEKLTQLDSSFLHKLLDHVPHELLAKALHLSEPAETEFFLLHLSQNAAAIVEEELDLNPSLPKVEAVKARQQIIDMTRSLLEERHNA